MKKLPIILTSFCTGLICCPSSQAAEVESGVPFYQNHAHVNLFDFDDYDARMAAMDEQDRIAAKQINKLYAPLDIKVENPGNFYRSDEDDPILQNILAESIRTAQIEENQRKLNVAHEEKAVVQEPPVIDPHQPAEWEPSNGHVVRAGALVMELRRSKDGVNPARDEMITYLLANMDVTAVQAEKILEELGLID